MSRRLLPLIPAGLFVSQVLPEPDRVVIMTQPRATQARCPTCDGRTGRVHSHYVRCLADLPWQGRRVEVRVRARRFRCAVEGCSRRIFAERLPEVAQPWARRTARLGDLQHAIGLALGGQPGARLAERLAMPASGDTLLRLVTSRPPRASQTPRVLGVDDWAWRRGPSYGTVLVDLEERRVVDLLPDREAATLAAWLRDHPGVEVIARDRAGAYAEGARRGAPDAVQVADRWHLLRNLTDALQLVVDRNRRRLRDAAQTVAGHAAVQVPPPPPRPPTQLEQYRRARQADRDARFARVARLAAAGQGLRTIARETGLARNTVRGWLATGRPPAWLKDERPSIVDPFMPYLQARLAEGYRNVTRLWNEIREKGFQGKAGVVRAGIARLQDGGAPTCRARKPVWRPPSARGVTRMLLSNTVLPEHDAMFVATIREGEIGVGADLARRFAAMVRERDLAALPKWLDDARIGPLAGFARSLRRDRAAVEAALSTPWSTGPVEGKITKLKLIKRSMYGRANIALLRQRVLAA